MTWAMPERSRFILVRIGRYCLRSRRAHCELQGTPRSGPGTDNARPTPQEGVPNDVQVMSCQLFFVALLVRSRIAGKEEKPTGLTETSSEAITDMNAASAKFDANAICAMLDDIAVMSLEQIKFSGPDLLLMREDQCGCFLCVGMKARSQAGATYETSTVVDEIKIASDGSTGEVKYASTVRVVASGQTLRLLRR